MYNKLINKKEKISVVGLGYVGLPLAIELSKYFDVIGFDINNEKINSYKNGHDLTSEVGDELLKNSNVYFTSDCSKLKSCKFHIIAVPTPINPDKTPNLNPVLSASEIVGKNLTKDCIVVYESTVYPGTTEDICIDILEKASNLVFKKDFRVGYSPERINPSDKENTLVNIVKVVSGCDDYSLSVISSVYETIIKAGVYKAESIKVAEACKVIENTQRDINIAFMNEISIVFDKMDIDTNEVLNAASTKWNFLNFKPGLVGGHCIGVDPYYFIYKAKLLGYNSQLISSARKINDEMSEFVVNSTIKKLMQSNKLLKDCNVLILGITFKENCCDTRNTKVVDIVNKLSEYDANILIYDPIASKKEFLDEYNLNLCSFKDIKDIDVVILAVSHDKFNDLTLDKLSFIYKDDKKILIDIKSKYNKKEAIDKGFIYFNL